MHHRLAYFDSLTGLANRVLFEDRLTQAFAHAGRYHSTLAVLFLDLDRFKVIHDTLGHNVGDLLLKQVAGRLSESVRLAADVFLKIPVPWGLLPRSMHGDFSGGESYTSRRTHEPC